MYKKLFLPLLLCFFYAAAVAQSSVTLYEDCNYGGKRYSLEAGSYRLYQMKINNDQLSSISIPYGMKVTIYEHDNFGGKSKTFFSGVPCLDADWNDMASSVVVENQSKQGSGNAQNDYVVFYNDCYSKGYSQTLRPGSYSGNQLGSLKYNISSFSIYGNLRIKAYINNENLSGYSIIYDANVSCLSKAENDKIASLVIEYKPNNTYPTNNYPNNNYPSNGNTNYATIYTDCNYGGNSLRLAPGYYQGDKLGLLRYTISSIQIPSNLQARVFVNNENLSGSYSTLSGNVSCMNNNLNNKIGSLIIEEINGNNQYPSNNNNYNNHNNNNYNNYNNYEKVVLYADKDYKGQSVSILPGMYSNMGQAGFPDKALSSLKIPDGYRVILYDEVNFRGHSYTMTASREGLGLPGWNDKTSSIAIYRDR